MGRPAATGGVPRSGRSGPTLSVDEATAAAQLTALNVLGTIERELGDLDNVECWLKINGYVNAIPGFTEHARSSTVSPT